MIKISDFTIKEILGYGSFSTIFLTIANKSIVHSKNVIVKEHKKYIIKSISIKKTSSSGPLERISQEIKALTIIKKYKKHHKTL